MTTLLRLWWAILIGGIVAAASAWVVLNDRPVEYRAEIRMLVGDLSGDFDRIRASEALATTYAELVTSETLLEAALAQSGLGLDPAALTDNVTATTVGTSRVLLVTVRYRSADVATTLANRIAATLPTFGGAPPGTLTLLDDAAEASPIPTRLVPLVAFAGLGGAAVIAGLLLLVPTSVPAPERRPAPLAW